MIVYRAKAALRQCGAEEAGNLKAGLGRARMGGVLASLGELFKERLERQKNRPFLEGVMAACAVVATSDGAVSFAEQVRVDQILQTLDQLKGHLY